MAADPITEYEHLRCRGSEALRSGRLREALESFTAALSLAEQVGDPIVLDRARCNRFAVAIELGDTAEAVRVLAPILMRQADDENCRLAAYNLARVYQIRKDLKRAMFYARSAQKYALALGRQDRIATGHSQIGSILLAGSYFDQALAEFETALAKAPEEASVERGIILDNLGYSLLLLGRPREGFRFLYQSLRMQRALGERLYQIGPRLSLCFGYLELGRYGRAQHHGRAALLLAEDAGEPEGLKAALFLLGESAKLNGLDLLARRYFSRLQESFFPKDTYLTDLLMVIDARQMINLKA